MKSLPDEARLWSSLLIGGTISSLMRRSPFSWRISRKFGRSVSLPVTVGKPVSVGAGAAAASASKKIGMLVGVAGARAVNTAL